MKFEELGGLFARLEHVRRWHSVAFVSRERMGERTDPSISTIREIWLYSLVPGKRGRPRKSSTQMQPRDHMSIEAS